MLYVFTGTDIIPVREKAHAHAHAYETKGSTIETLTAEMCTKEALEDRAGGASLFGDTTVYLIDTPSESKEALEAVVDAAHILSESPNPFVLLEGKLLAADARALKACAIEYNEIRPEKKTPTFNIFSLADAFARRDKKSLWILLMRARTAGLTTEEIVGTLFWQVKTMRLVARTKSASEAGVKPFVHQKAVRALQKYTKEEADRISGELVDLYHRGHLGMIDIDHGLERFVLRL